MKTLLIGLFLAVLLCTATGCHTTSSETSSTPPHTSAASAASAANAATTTEAANAAETPGENGTPPGHDPSPETPSSPADTFKAPFPATGYVTCNTLLVRKIVPNIFDVETSAPLGSLPFGARVQVTSYVYEPYSRQASFWYEIEWKGQPAFVAQQFISFAPPDFSTSAFETGIVTKAGGPDYFGQVTKTDAKTQKKSVLYEQFDNSGFGFSTLTVWNNRIYFDGSSRLSWITADGKTHGSVSDAGSELFAWDGSYLYSTFNSSSFASRHLLCRTDKAGGVQTMALPIFKNDADSHTGVMVISGTIYVITSFEDAESPSEYSAHLYAANWNGKWIDLGELPSAC